MGSDPIKNRINSKRWRDKHKDESNKRIAEWAKAHPESGKRRCAKYEKEHREERNLAMRQRVAKDPLHYLAIRIKSVYGLDIEEYNKMLEIQNNVCAICLKPESYKGSNGKIKRLSVDHNHENGKVRGLICFCCNTGLGNFKDNQQTMLNAIKYLQDRS